MRALWFISAILSFSLNAGELETSFGRFLWDGDNEATKIITYVEGTRHITYFNGHTFGIFKSKDKDAVIVIDRMLRRTDRVYILKAFESQLRYLEVKTSLKQRDHYEYIYASVSEDTVEFKYIRKNGKEKVQKIDLAEALASFDLSEGKEIELAEVHMSIE